MHQPWDKLMKMLVRANPQDFLSLITQDASYVSDITNEQIIRSVEADFLCKAQRKGEEVIIHAEFQRRRDENMGRRMWEYNSATSFLTHLPVCSFALYLWKHKKIVKPPYIIKLGDGEIVSVLNYKNILLWEEPSEILKQPGTEGMLPLLPLTKGAKQARNETIEDMVDGLRTAGKEDILALGYAFAGLVYNTKGDKEWLKRRFAMFHEILESSWSYQEMVQKGIDQGIDQGLKKGWLKGMEHGELKASYSFLIRLVEKHFPELLPLAQQQIAQINNVELLDAIIDKLLSVQTIEQAKQVLTASDTSDRK